MKELVHLRLTVIGQRLAAGLLALVTLVSLALPGALAYADPPHAPTPDTNGTDPTGGTGQAPTTPNNPTTTPSPGSASQAYDSNVGDPPFIDGNERLRLANEGIYYIDNPCGGSILSGTANGADKGTDSGTWDSASHGAVGPPYILEQFMIQLLKDIAAKRGIPESDTVTINHVVALVAFAYGEGGGITNQDWWNPFNAGIDAPDLLATGHATDGVQAFKSFDAGVEANARVMSGGHPQTRLGKVLSDPNSSVDNFFTVLTYYNDQAKLGSYYSAGDLAWATLSQQDPDSYKSNYMNHIYPDVVKNWNQLAGAIMRGSSNDAGGMDSSKLVYHPTFSATGSVPDSGGYTTDTGCNPITATGSVAGYANPLRDIKHNGGKPGPVRERIDEGVDYFGSGPLYAVGDGVIMQVNNNTGWPLGHWVNYKVTAGKATGLFIYVAEDCIPAPGLKAGDIVHANTVICNMTSTSPGIEMGWAIPVPQGSDNRHNALASVDYVEGHPMRYGVNFSEFMQAIGGPPGDINQSTGGILGTIPSNWPTWP
ncbi:MAG TPA: hypothetical protein VLF71_00940 [Candidatus Saccharimonadales bacterium]|nr:hypothetical protein [Candidatus Saccharimonadales bacterium]